MNPVTLFLKQSTKQKLLFQLEQLATLLLCKEISFFSKEAKQNLCEEIDTLMLALFNLSAQSAQQVNGIDDLVVEISVEHQNAAMQLLLKNKNLFIEQNHDKWLIHSMVMEEKKQLARSNRDMCNILMDLPINDQQADVNLPRNDKRNRCRTRRATENKAAPKTKAIKRASSQEVENIREVLNTKTCRNANKNTRKVLNIHVEDEVEQCFAIHGLAEAVKNKNIWLTYPQFDCNNLPWIVEFKLSKQEVAVILLCDYKSKDRKDWSVATNFELRLLSQVQGVADKLEIVSNVFMKSDNGTESDSYRILINQPENKSHQLSIIGVGFMELDFIHLDDLTEASPYVQDDRAFFELKLMAGPLTKHTKKY